MSKYFHFPQYSTVHALILEKFCPYQAASFSRCFVGQSPDRWNMEDQLWWRIWILKHFVWCYGDNFQLFYWNEASCNLTNKYILCFTSFCRFIYTCKLDTGIFESDVKLAFKTMKCAGRYFIPALHILCRNWIIKHIRDTFKTSKGVRKNALRYALHVSEFRNEYFCLCWLLEIIAVR